MSGTLRLDTFTKATTTTTIEGTKTAPRDFVMLTVQTANGELRVTLDLEDWSRLIAKPGTVTPATLEVPGAVRR